VLLLVAVVQDHLAVVQVWLLAASGEMEPTAVAVVT
jgi:hypothetical protein